MGPGKYVNDTNKTMRTLTDIFEGLLDADFDVELTWGDIAEFKPKFNERNDGPSSFDGYAWDNKAFWAQYNNVQNAWTQNKHIIRKNPIRLNYIKADIRHGFAMYVLTRPADMPMTQKNIDQWAKEMGEWCIKDKLRINAKLKKESGMYEIQMWNDALKDSIKSYMGKFYIIPNSMSEGLLDVDYDITDKDISINSTYPLNHKMWRIIPAMMDRIFQNANKAFFEKITSTPEHIVDSGFGTKNICRYFLDWLATQPIGMLNGEEFTASKPKLAEAFDQWVGNPKFTLTMTKMGNTKVIYFNYNKRQLLSVKFES